jgi:spore maturation protein CgeB
MRIVCFYHSLLSDWNHGNAHFLRGLVSELLQRGHTVKVYEPRDGWSLSNLLRDHGDEAVAGFRARYPGLESAFYDLATLDLDEVLEGADLVLVHEWSDHQLVQRIGEHRARARSYALLFHDTHHRLVTQPEEMGRYDLRHYDGVLAFGQVLRDLYLKRGLAQRAWTFHEAADTRRFKPQLGAPEGDVVWIGNWGDEERTEELHEFLLGPVARLGLKTVIHGVRYPEHALAALRAANIEYRNFLPNYLAPEVFAHFKLTVHVPRRPYVKALVGVPTIRVFEALACGIPLISAPWDDVEQLFRPGQDFLVARDGAEMERHIQTIIHEPAHARELATQGLATIHERHSCAHRAEELLAIAASLGAGSVDGTKGAHAAGKEETCQAS